MVDELFGSSAVRDAIDDVDDANTADGIASTSTPTDTGSTSLSPFGGGGVRRLTVTSCGDHVLVHRDDGTTARFTVNRVEQHAKDDFPTRAVYGPTTAPTLRLITCGGSFDQTRSSYNDNIVVFATLTTPQR